MSGDVKRSRIAARFIGAFCAATLLLPSLARAEYPDRPIRLIIPFAAGGATDILGRSVADFLGKEFKQSVVVENKPGANTVVAAELVANAAPDGYTLLIAAASTLVLNPLLYKKPTIDVKAFRPLSIMVEIPLIMVVNKSVPAQSVAEFIAYTKANPGKVNYASSGAGGPLHLAGELFNISAGVDMTHVPYRGSAPALTDLISGQVQVMFDPVSSSLGHVRGGSLRALAVTGAERASVLPDVPTVAESGFCGFPRDRLVRPGRAEGPARRHRTAPRRRLRQGAVGSRVPQDAGRARLHGDAAGWRAGLRALHPAGARSLVEGHQVAEHLARLTAVTVTSSAASRRSCRRDSPARSRR